MEVGNKAIYRSFQYTGLLRWVSVVIIIITSSGSVLAQKSRGILLAQVRDSAHNFAMQAATVSIYNVATKQLVSYQLSDNFGRVEFRGLPTDTALFYIATNIGYAPLKNVFTIPGTSAELNIGTINMMRKAVSLKEITITGEPPPVQMHADTLEFNAEAFKLDSNAVMEDLLKKLPGITIWSDGVITVNGKKVNKLLVDGKVFFDSGGKIALQNLSKDAIKKVQVYEDKSGPDPLDVKTNMNVVLKDNKKDGYFGKVGVGVGTNGRYDGDAMISYFSPRDQVSIVGAINNLNKSANNANTLIAINSYKGSELNNDYVSDFSKPGILVYKAFGVTLLHDFDKRRRNTVDTNNLKVEYFLNNNNNIGNERLSTVFTLGPNEQLHQTTKNNSSSNTLGQFFRTEYNKTFDHSRLSASYKFFHNTEDISSDLNTQSVEESGQISSEQHDAQQSRNKTTGHEGGIDFKTNRYTDHVSHRSKSVDMTLSYFFSDNHTENDRVRLSDLVAIDTVQNKHFNRHYFTNTNLLYNSIANSLNDVLRLTGNEKPAFKVDMKNFLSYSLRRQTDVVADYSTTFGQYLRNDSLTNEINVRVIDYKPGLYFTKFIVNKLSNRYRKAWQFDLFSQGEIYNFNSTSPRGFQNLNQSYFYFVPTAGVEYTNDQFNSFRKLLSLKYLTSVLYPDLQQLAPLVDDANVSFLSFGNSRLKPSYSHDLEFRYHYDNKTSNDPFQGELNARAGLTNNFITDSSYYDLLGRIIYFPINVSGEHHGSLGGSLQKAFKRNAHQLQVSGRTRFGISTHQSSINGDFYQIKSHLWTADAGLTYSFKELTAQLGESYFNNSSNRPGTNDYQYSSVKTYVSFAFIMSNGLFFDSRIDFNRSWSTNVDNLFFNIWNANLGYRFLKARNLEIKMSGLDLLHQNKNIVSYISNNSISTGTVNVLQQYFMLTLAYYPRKFGLKVKAD